MHTIIRAKETIQSNFYISMTQKGSLSVLLINKTYHNYDTIIVTCHACQKTSSTQQKLAILELKVDVRKKCIKH